MRKSPVLWTKLQRQFKHKYQDNGGTNMKKADMFFLAVIFLTAGSRRVSCSASETPSSTARALTLQQSRQPRRHKPHRRRLKRRPLRRRPGRDVGVYRGGADDRLTEPIATTEDTSSTVPTATTNRPNHSSSVRDAAQERRIIVTSLADCSISSKTVKMPKAIGIFQIPRRLQNLF